MSDLLKEATEFNRKASWTLDNALILIRTLQPIAKKYQFHLALAGGVLNNGKSNKDLDILVAALNNTGIPTDKSGFIIELQKILGCECSDGDDSYDGDEAAYDDLVIFHDYPTGRIDFFIYDRPLVDEE